MEKKTFERAIAYMNLIATRAVSQLVNKENDDIDLREAIEIVKKSTDVNFWKDVLELDDEKKTLLGFVETLDTKDSLIPIWIIECLPDNFDAIVKNYNDGKEYSIKDIEKETYLGTVHYSMVEVVQAAREANDECELYYAKVNTKIARDSKGRFCKATKKETNFKNIKLDKLNAELWDACVDTLFARCYHCIITETGNAPKFRSADCVKTGCPKKKQVKGCLYHQYWMIAKKVKALKEKENK